jgi:hypothetical protein
MASEADSQNSTFAIEAWIEVRGTQLTGRMLDAQPVRETRFADVVTAQRSFISSHILEFVEKYPNAVYRANLSPDSTLQGTVKGRNISFTKTYSRPGKFTIAFDGRERTTVQGKPIFYSGELSEDGNQIRGFYRTSRNALKRASRIREPFTLVRQ